jgi:hypothetical protein
MTAQKVSQCVCVHAVALRVHLCVCTEGAFVCVCTEGAFVCVCTEGAFVCVCVH